MNARLIVLSTLRQPVPVVGRAQRFPARSCANRDPSDRSRLTRRCVNIERHRMQGRRLQRLCVALSTAPPPFVRVFTKRHQVVEQSSDSLAVAETMSFCRRSAHPPRDPMAPTVISRLRRSSWPARGSVRARRQSPARPMMWARTSDRAFEPCRCWSLAMTFTLPETNRNPFSSPVLRLLSEFQIRATASGMPSLCRRCHASKRPDWRHGERPVDNG